MIYIPANVLADARNEHSACIVHHTHPDKFRVETTFSACIIDAELKQVVCFALDGEDGVFAPGYAELTYALAMKIADNSEEAEDDDLFAAFDYFMSQESEYKQNLFRTADMDQKRKYLYLINNVEASV